MHCDISIIIVNYNVRYFLAYCLFSIKQASSDIIVETIVVDNASTDDSYEWVAEKYPETLLIRNEQNVGFAKANNQGLKLAKGAFVLFLNPDTLLSEYTLKDCLTFFKNQKDCGTVGVHMMDGQGHFLPESKRSLPTPTISFYKFSGLERFFPRSKIFGQYALGYLDQHSIHQVPVLAGAFLMVRRHLLESVGGFDESFFMYGEDIDLSYRLQHQTGFKNYFLGNVKIVHFKGESSKQNSQHYHKIFYEAMDIFVKKYHHAFNAFLMRVAIRLGTWMQLVIERFKRKKDPNEQQQKSFFLKGEEDAINKLKEGLIVYYPNISLAKEESSLSNIVFCLGSDFTLGNAIVEMKAKSGNFFWYEKNINVVMGSNDKNQVGTILDFDNKL